MLPVGEDNDKRALAYGLVTYFTMFFWRELPKRYQTLLANGLWYSNMLHNVTLELTP